MTNCVNCGAVLHGAKCEYCGTEYTHGNAVVKCKENEAFVTIDFQGKKYKAYLCRCEIHTLCRAAGRDVSGSLRATGLVLKHKWEFIEV